MGGPGVSGVVGQDHVVAVTTGQGMPWLWNAELHGFLDLTSGWF